MARAHLRQGGRWPSGSAIQCSSLGRRSRPTLRVYSNISESFCFYQRSIATVPCPEHQIHSLRLFYVFGEIAPSAIHSQALTLLGNYPRRTQRQHAYTPCTNSTRLRRLESGRFARSNTAQLTVLIFKVPFLAESMRKNESPDWYDFKI